MNKAILIGRLTRDPEVRYSAGENSTAVARFTLAVNRKFKRQGDTQDADFLSCIAFGKNAEFIEKYFKQGMKAEIQAHVQTGSYINKDGVKVYTTDFVIDEIDFAESKREDGGQSSPSKPEPSLAQANDFMSIPDGIDENLPFN
jgi:single-strand DNA-binding protein